MSSPMTYAQNPMPVAGSEMGMGRLFVTGLEKSYRGRTVVQDAGL